MTHRMLSVLLMAVLLLAGCTSQPPTESATSEAATSQSRQVYAMDTVMTLEAYGDHATAALDAAEEEITRLDTLWSISSADGEIARLNAEKQVTASEDTLTLLARAKDLSAETAGLFSATIAPLMEAWGFTSGDYRVPSDEELESLLAHVDDSQIAIKGDRVSIPNDVKVDLGGIAKGFTSSRVMKIFADEGVKHGIISLGGNVQTLGKKPDDSLWRVGIQDPKSTEDVLGILEIADKAVITSGAYQRNFEKDGVIYHHIIDPRTGRPANSGLTSVTIVSDDGTLADGLSTSLFIMGREQALDYWRAHKDEFDAVLVEEDGSVTITDGLRDCFSLTSGDTPEVVS